MKLSLVCPGWYAAVLLAVPIVRAQDRKADRKADARDIR